MDSNWPNWWEWDIELSSHCLKRMQERTFSELNLRFMLEDATSLQEQGHGTFIIGTTSQGVQWEVIVVPDYDEQKVIVVTAYPIT